MRWMAPELLDPVDDFQATPTIQSDVYSFGSIMLQVRDTGTIASLLRHPIDLLGLRKDSDGERSLSLSPTQRASRFCHRQRHAV